MAEIEFSTFSHGFGRHKQSLILLIGMTAFLGLPLSERGSDIQQRRPVGIGPHHLQRSGQPFLGDIILLGQVLPLPFGLLLLPLHLEFAQCRRNLVAVDIEQ